LELVYLWIEKYKNIKKQGFCFTPKFDCNFNGNILTIKETNYKNIFPENLNITAIVGKNGSGNSNLLEILFFILKDREYVNDIKYILVYKQNYIYYKINKLKIENINNKINFKLEKNYDRFKDNLILNLEHNLIKNTKENLWYKKLIKEQELRNYENFYIKFPYLLNYLNIYRKCINKIKFNIFFNTFVLEIKLFNIERFYRELQEDKHYISLLIKKLIDDFLQLESLNPLQKIQKQRIFEKK
jgi:energy-coupling factor transporter ATP-binding protein EcfA2